MDPMYKIGNRVFRMLRNPQNGVTFQYYDEDTRQTVDMSDHIAFQQFPELKDWMEEGAPDTMPDYQFPASPITGTANLPTVSTEAQDGSVPVTARGPIASDPTITPAELQQAISGLQNVSGGDQPINSDRPALPWNQILSAMAQAGAMIGGEGSVGAALGGAAQGMINGEQAALYMQRAMRGDSLAEIEADPRIRGISAETRQQVLNQLNAQRELNIGQQNADSTRIGANATKKDSDTRAYSAVEQVRLGDAQLDLGEATLDETIRDNTNTNNTQRYGIDKDLEKTVLTLSQSERESVRNAQLTREQLAAQREAEAAKLRVAQEQLKLEHGGGPDLPEITGTTVSRIEDAVMSIYPHVFTRMLPTGGIDFRGSLNDRRVSSQERTRVNRAQAIATEWAMRGIPLEGRGALIEAQVEVEEYLAQPANAGRTSAQHTATGTFWKVVNGRIVQDYR